MRSKSFHFKQFSVVHDHTSHKVGTDGVLLGAWVDIGKCVKRILDIGTGTGVIALMLAQRTSPEVKVDAVEIDKNSAMQAQENFERSPWAHRLSVHHSAVQAFQAEAPYDLVVSNPPYFVNSLSPPDARRSVSRHTHELSFAALLQDTLRLLSTHGSLAVILPYKEGISFIRLAEAQGLYPRRKTSFKARQNKAVERLLLELTRQRGGLVETALTLYGTGDAWSEDYKRLTGEFYLDR